MGTEYVPTPHPNTHRQKCAHTPTRAHTPPRTHAQGKKGTKLARSGMRPNKSGPRDRGEGRASASTIDPAVFVVLALKLTNKSGIRKRLIQHWMKGRGKRKRQQCDQGFLGLLLPVVPGVSAAMEILERRGEQPLTPPGPRQPPDDASAPARVRVFVRNGNIFVRRNGKTISLGADMTTTAKQQVGLALIWLCVYTCVNTTPTTEHTTLN